MTCTEHQAAEKDKEVLTAEDQKNVKTETAVTEVRTEIVEPQENQVIFGKSCRTKVQKNCTFNFKMWRWYMNSRGPAFDVAKFCLITSNVMDHNNL